MGDVGVLVRCGWVTDDVIYQEYHDQEWGVPVHEDRKLFEMLCLEGMQAGLSWLTVLKKREAFKLAFDDFEVDKIIDYGEEKIGELLLNEGIIRNRLKIRSVVGNAKAFKEVQKEFGSFDAYIWSFVGDEPIVGEWEDISEIPVRTELSDLISKDLKRRGFNFVGSTIIYAFMQAVGLVDDHVKGCFCKVVR